MTRAVVVATIAVLVAASCTHDRVADPGAEREVDVDGVHALEIGGDDAPVVVVALHGRGGNPRNLLHVLDGSGLAVEVASLRAPLPFGTGTQWFEWPQGMTDAEFTTNVDTAERAVWPAIAAIAHGRKLVVTGFSQGAVLSYVLACHHPRDIALAVPIAGRAPLGVSPTCAPVVALHGDADDVIQLAFDQQTVAALRAGGTNIELHTFEGVKHQLTREMRDTLVAAIKASLSSPSSQAP